MTIIGKLFNPSSRPRRAAHRKADPTQAFQAVADVAGTLRSYENAPWHIQRQWVMTFIVGVVMVAVVAGLYLNVTARAALAGRDIQNLEAEITNNQNINADLQTKIASELSNGELEQRSKSMGFAPEDRTTLEYIVVPGYFPAQGVSFAQSPTSNDLVSNTPEFHQSLIDWFSQQVKAASEPLTDVK